MDSRYKTLFHFNHVPVKASPGFWLLLPMMWGAMTWLAGRRKPGRSFHGNLLAGFLSLVLALFADLGHALAHSFSARYAGAPMDEVRLSMNMQRTIYFDDDVEPRAHMLRAVGGPLFSAAGLLLSAAWRIFSKPRSLSRELADISVLSHSFIFFGSLAPLPFVDGGSILKWSRIERDLALDAGREIELPGS